MSPAFIRASLPGMDSAALLSPLRRIADALERLSPPPPPPADLTSANAFIWEADPDRLEPVAQVAGVDLELLHGIDRQADLLRDNTRAFAAGFPANNALLWGARGTGKSSLIKAVHAAVNAEHGAPPLGLVEIHREDLTSLPRLLRRLKASPRRFVLFCDDLSFEARDDAYKSLKAVLEGGLEGRPANVVFYATSNRRHLMARSMIENESAGAIDPGEAVEEKVSLSDRFGLWLGFHHMDQDTYFRAVIGYAARFALDVPETDLKRQANEWSVTRGARSGRVAWQFIQDLAGRLGKRLG